MECCTVEKSAYPTTINNQIIATSGFINYEREVSHDQLMGKYYRR